jgi:uncharacterized phage protein gp47/JayE
MRFFNRNFEDLVSFGLQRLSEGTNITQLTPGSKTRFFLDTIFEEQVDQHDVFNTNMMQAFIRFADSEFLDYFGDMLNIKRRVATFAQTTASEQNFMFYVSSGTFGNINSGADFIVPEGAIVTSVPFVGDIATPGLEDQPIIRYTTTADITCRADSSFAYGSIRSTVEGKDYNVPRNVINKHSFTDYSLSGRNLLKCTNKHAISVGTERETDNSYRYQLLNAFKAKEQAVRIAVRLAALSVPGVSDITEVNYEQGPGSYSIYVQALTPTTSQGLLNQVTDAVTEVTSLGNRPFVLAPTPMGTELVMAVNWSPRASTAQKSSVYATIRDNTETVFSLYNMGESVFIADLARTVISSSEHILGIGLEKTNSFENVYITRSSADGSGVTRSVLVGNIIEPLYNERVILETSGRNRGIEFVS